MKPLICLLSSLLILPLCAAETLSIKVDRSAFFGNADRSIEITLNGKTSTYSIFSLERKTDGTKLSLKGEDGVYFGIIALRSDGDLVVDPYNTNRPSFQHVWSGKLSSEGEAILEEKPRHVNITQWPGVLYQMPVSERCESEHTNGEPPLQKLKRDQFAFDTEILEAAQPCLRWSFETPEGELDLVVDDVTLYGSDFFTARGTIIDEGKVVGRYGPRRQLFMEAFEGCGTNDKEDRPCWEIKFADYDLDREHYAHFVTYAAVPIHRSSDADTIQAELIKYKWGYTPALHN